MPDSESHSEVSSGHPAAGSGEMAGRVSRFDWGRTPLGPMLDWSAGLRTAVGICLGSRFPMFIWWGPDLIYIYNDAYIPVLGKRHPDALGRSGSEVWAEVWSSLGPQVDAVIHRGESTWHRRVPLVLERNGFSEKAFFTWSYSPIPDGAGKTAGLLCVCTEDTQEVLSEQERDRLAAQRQLALDAADLGWWHLNPQTEVATYDGRFARMFGLTGREIPHAAIRARIHPDDIPELWSRVEAALNPADPRPFSAEYRIVPEPGVIRRIEARGSVTFEGTGPDRRAVSFVGTVADVTARREAEDRARTILESITDSFFAVDRDWRFTYVNPQADRALDRVPGSMLGKSLWEEFPGLAGSEFERAYRQAAADRKSASITSYYSDFDRWYEVHVYPAPDGGLAIYFQDVTERKRIENSARDLAERFERQSKLFDQIASSTPDFIYIFGLDFRFIYANRRLLEVWGTTLERAVGKSLPELGYPDWHVQMHHRELRQVIATKRPVKGEVPFTGGSGISGVYEYIFTPVLGPDGDVEVIAGTTRDVSDRKRAEAALRESEQRRRLALDSAELGTWNYHPAAGSLVIDARFRSMFDIDISSGPVDFERVANVIHPDDRGRVLDAVAAAVRPENPVPYAIDYRVVHRDGSVRWVYATGRSNSEPDGSGQNVITLDGTVADITDRKRLEDRQAGLLESERAARVEAERAGRMKDEFLATLSHELRTPLNAILGWASILSAGTPAAEELRDGLETIRRNARSQAQIIEDLLDMSRIVNGKIRLDVQRVDLAEVVRAAVETVRPAADARGVRLRTILDPQAGPVSGDPGRLQQVFWNLLNNAVKFTPRGGQVEVLLERVNSHLEVTVADTGEGIEPRFLPFVFDRFRQADGSTTRRHGGLGLGLSIVKQLVELHGGGVRVKSSGPGRGSTFTVDIPVTAVHTDPDETDRRHPAALLDPPATDDPSPRLTKIRVLVVDDEPDARQLLKRLLEDCDAIVRTASTADEAIALITAEPPDVLVSDIGMPQKDGYTLIRRVRELAPSRGGTLPAVALTAYARTEDRVRALRAGFQTHIVKPVEPTELITVVASLTGRMK